jgi:hypothetical protein
MAISVRSRRVDRRDALPNSTMPVRLRKSIDDMDVVQLLEYVRLTFHIWLGLLRSVCTSFSTWRTPDKPCSWPNESVSSPPGRKWWESHSPLGQLHQQLVLYSPPCSR